MLETLYEGEVAEVVARRGEEDVADLRQLLHLCQPLLIRPTHHLIKSARRVSVLAEWGA